MECRCKHMDILYGTEAEEYAAEHLVSDGAALVCRDTGARWRVEERDGQEVLQQVDAAEQLSRRPQS